MNDHHGAFARSRWPVAATEAGTVSSGFGWRRHPVTGKRSFHAAIDIAAPKGSPVLATTAGTVAATGRHPRLGRYVMIRYRDGSVGTYGHLDSIRVRADKAVKPGQIIGTVGDTGRTTGPHLDYSLEVDGRKVDPLKYFQTMRKG